MHQLFLHLFLSFHIFSSYKTSYTFLDGCKSVCGKYGSLWPQPTKNTNIGPKLAIFHIDDLAVKFDTSRLVSIEVI